MPKWTPPTAEELAAAEARIGKDKEQLQAMKDNFEQTKADLEANFEKNLESMLTPQEKTAVEDSSPQEQWQIYATKYKSEVEDKIDVMREQIDAFEDNLYKYQLALENRKIDMKVVGDNPDLDLQAFHEWVSNDLTPRMQAELLAAAGKDKAKFAELLVAKYIEVIGASEGKPAPAGEEEKKEDDMPTDISNIAGETGDIDNNDGDVDTDNNDFLSKSGMYK